MTGKFIVIEGADGVGSSTQSSMLYHYLVNTGVPAHITAEPSKGTLGVLTREILRKEKAFDHHALALLFAADRLDHYYREIKPKLDSGINVISDRYVLSSYVYQSLDCDLEWIEKINSMAPRPDVTVIVSLPFEKAWERIATRISEGKATEELFDERTLQEKIHNKYNVYASMVDGVVVSGDSDRESVFKDILLQIERLGITNGAA